MLDILNLRKQRVEEARVSARVLNIFQLPAMIGCRISLPLSVSTSTPGSFWPERNSSDAPPPVEICVIFDSMPDCATAAAESPPPTIENAFDSATARAIAKVPCANLGFSKTPIGPFQTIVCALPQ